MSRTKIVEPAYVRVLCEELHRRKARIVFTNGVFDLLHPGHVAYLDRARHLGTHLIVACNTDDSVRRIKGEKRPLVPLEARCEVLAALYTVSFVTWFDEDTPWRIIEEVRPEVLVKGGDWEPDRIVGKSFVESYGGYVLSIPFVPGYSTSDIVNRILALTGLR